MLSTLTFLSMGSTNKENNSTEKSEEHMSCRLTSVEAEEGLGTSAETEIAKNSAQGTKRKRDTKNSTACGPGDTSQCCDGVKPPRTPTQIPIPPLPSVLPPVNLVHRDVIRAWCQQLKLSTKGPVRVQSGAEAPGRKPANLSLIVNSLSSCLRN